MLYSNIIDFAHDVHELEGAIDNIPKDREWGKIPLLVNSFFYLTFLKEAMGSTTKEIVQYFQDFLEDKTFYEECSPKLTELEGIQGGVGDLRLNSLAVYIATRVLKPNIVVETGVAAGKSSALFLLALEHNQKGKLISIDVPNKKGHVMKDGSATTTFKKEVGWLVPPYLRGRWNVILEDSRDVLPRISDKIDLFMHDSLHTYEHALFEFQTVLRMGTHVILCDNLETGAGKAFSQIVAANNSVGYAYRNFGVLRM